MLYNKIIKKNKLKKKIFTKKITQRKYITCIKKKNVIEQDSTYRIFMAHDFRTKRQIKVSVRR